MCIGVELMIPDWGGIKEMSLFTNIAYMAKVENKGIILVNKGSEFLTEDTIFKKIKNIIY